MKFGFKYRLYIGFAFVFLLSLDISITSYTTFRQQIKRNMWVGHSYEILKVAQDVQKLMIDMETGRRGFRATNEKRFLQPFYEGINQITPAVLDLKNLVDNNPQQERKATLLEKNINDLLQFWKDKGDDAGEYNRELITKITDDEKIRMDVIRGNINDLSEAENALLAQKEKDNTHSILVASWTSILGIIMIQAIIFVLIVLILLESKKNRNVRGKLKEFNEELISQKETLLKSEKDLKQALDKVEEVNKQLEKFVYTVAHDIKSPLAGISGSLSRLKKHDTILANSMVAQFINLSYEQSVHLSEMVNSILEYSRISLGDQQVDMVNTKVLVEELAALMYPPQHIHIAVADDMPVLVTKRIKIIEVFQNLIGNAIKYNNKETGYIEVGCSEKDQFFEFFVKDNGCGISEENQHHIFSLFRTSSNTPMRESSTGFGLNIVKLIVEEQGGKIWVDSVPEEGSIFYFEWKK